jgi:pyruvate, orthophosphate dikinase
VPHVYALDHRHDLTSAELNALIGSKAAGLATMITILGLPVPPGFAITTVACNAYLKGGWPEELDAEIRTNVSILEKAAGRQLGDPHNPLLVSVRSGAPVSMPGMMDSILNLGLNEETTDGLAMASGDATFADDCHRRFRTMFTDIVGVDAVPHDPWLQLRMAVEAVFKSWNGDRARAYRARELIAGDLGTAVTVQAMVFGNLGEDSASGVLFTRNPATGEPALYGDVLFVSQGEDVVAGTHATQPLGVLETRMPEAAGELRRYADSLERHFADLCDVEFTIERGQLWLLQVRAGKRTPQAALRIAVDMAEAGDFPLTRADAVNRAAPYLVHPPMVSTAPLGAMQPLATGLPASPGVATGEIATSSAAAQETAAAGRDAILVRTETSPEDVQGMAAAVGVLTASGGLASHAAVVARGWGIPAVVGARGLQIGDGMVLIGDRTLQAGDTISIDGGTGEIFAGEVPRTSTIAPEAATLLAWARELGIEVSAGGDDTETQLQDAAPVTADDAVRTLDIKASVTPDALAAALMSSTTQVQPVLHRLVADGLAERAGGMFRLTGKGRLRARELMSGEQERWGHDRALAALDGFAALDGRMKQTVTAWQLKDLGSTQMPNDHSDAEYDEDVLAQLAALHDATASWLSSLDPAPQRLHAYCRRLERALRHARGGDERFVASPRVDSYHSVWFELHEDLIRLAGRSRAEETAAGRA